MIDNLSKIDSMYIEKEVSKGYTSYYSKNLGKMICKKKPNRKICAPIEELKTEQRRILYEELNNIKIHEAAYGFVNDKSIYDNAKQHLGNTEVLNIDLKNFFDTVTREQVLNALIANGVDTKKAEYISRVCTRHGSLPQGAPTSPTLSNIVVKPMDRKLTALCNPLGMKYTRYADDITISCNDYNKLQEIKPVIHDIVRSHGLKINSKKVKTVGGHHRQEVTGVVVNKHTNITREKVRFYESRITHIEKCIQDGTIKCLDDIRKVKGMSWASLHGYVNFIHDSNPAHKALLDRVLEIRKKLK